MIISIKNIKLLCDLHYSLLLNKQLYLPYSLTYVCNEICID